MKVFDLSSFQTIIILLFTYSDYAVYSNFTWKLFEDSGWYKVNYTFINTIEQYNLEWGKGELTYQL